MNDATRMRSSKGILLAVFAAAALTLAAGGYAFCRNQARSIRPDRHNDLKAVAELKVAQIDTREILSEAHHRDEVILVLVVLGIVMAGVTAVFLINRRQRSLYENLYRAERKQREVQEEIRATIYGIGDGVIATDTAGCVTRMNPAAEKLSGWNEAEALGRPANEVFRIVSDGNRAEVESSFGLVLRTGQVAGLPNHAVLIARDGSERPIADSAAPIRDEQGAIIGVVLVFRDQTAERAAQKALLESERRYRTLVESLPHLVWTCRADGPCDYLSRRWTDYTGIPEADQLGYGWLEQLHPDDRERVIAEWSEVAPRGGDFDIEFRIRRADGVHRWFKTRAIPFRDNAGRVVKWFGSNTDIDDHKRAEEEVRKLNAELDQRVRERTAQLEAANRALRASSAYVRSLIEASQDPLVTIGPDGKVTDVNTATELATGISREELIGTEFSSYFTEPQKASAGYQQVFAQGSVTDYPLSIRHKSGRVMDVLYNAAVYKDGAGNVQGVFAAARDITERKQAEEALLWSEARYRSFVAATSVLVWTTDAEGKVVADMPSWRAFTGQSEETARGWGWIEAVHPDDRERSAKVWSEAVGTKGTYEVEYRLRRWDGLYRDVMARGIPVLAADGRVREWVGTCTDITERKQAEDLLRASEQRYRSYIEVTGQVGWTTPPDGVVADMPTWRQYTGQSLDEVKGWGWLEAVHPDDVERTTLVWNRCVAEKSTYETEYRIRRRDGVYRHFLARGIPALKEDGSIREWVGTCIDITERKQAEEVLQKLNLDLTRRTMELEAVNRELEAFSYSVSHDLKAPLRSVDGFARFLQEDYADRLDDEGRRLLRVIRDSARDMGHLINDLLAFSRMSRKELDTEILDMGDLVREVWTQIEGGRAGRRVALRVGPLPAAFGDLATVREVLVNLLSNAVKFTRPRKEAVVEIAGEAQDGEIVYAIKDNGVGFDMAYKDKLFNVFQRLHGSEEFEGTGIGLALVKRIVQRHGGRVWAEGKVNEGATFCFTLSASSPKEEQR